MARGWHYTKLSLSSALLLSFSGMCFFCFCPFVFVVSVFVSSRFFVLFFCSRWSFVDVPLIFFCPADRVTDWQPRIILLLGTVEARSINVKKPTTTKTKADLVTVLYKKIGLRVPNYGTGIFFREIKLKIGFGVIIWKEVLYGCMEHRRTINHQNKQECHRKSWKMASISRRITEKNSHNHLA